LSPDGQSISGGYHVHKKAVVISFLARIKIYDEILFTNFFKHLDLVLTQATTSAAFKGIDLNQAVFEKAVLSVVST